MQKVKSEIQNDNKNIISLKCILHIINLISKDIARHQISRDAIKHNSKIVNFFKSLHLILSWIKEYQRSRKIKNGLKLFTETRWYSLSKLCLSIQSYKEAFKEAIKELNITNKEITEIINDHIHFSQNKYLLDLIKPIADNIAYLEKNSATLTDVFFSILDIYVKIEAFLIPRYVSLENIL